MKKIPTLFERDWDGDRSRVLDVPAPAAAWVFDGEGIATRKYDGSSCLVRDGALYRRLEVRPDRKTGIVPTPPFGFEAVETDKETGAIVGWLLVGHGPEDKWHNEAWNDLVHDANEVTHAPIPEGTYELLGPKVQGNPERFGGHRLLRHTAADSYPDAPTTFDGLKEWLAGKDIEGLVWHHPDGRMAKIKLRDFGLRRP